MNAVASLLEKWLTDAEILRSYGDARGGEVVQRLAGELEAAIREGGEEELTLNEAATESGYSERRIRELIADGTIPQAGRKGRPRVLRRDLPMKPGRRVPGAPYDAHSEARDVLARIGR